MAAVPHLLRTYDLTPHTAAQRKLFQALAALQVKVGTTRIQEDAVSGAFVLFLMDDVPDAVVQALDAAFKRSRSA